MKKTEFASSRRGKERQELFRAIFSLKDAGEIDSFLEDLCTPAELRALSDRWQVAQLLEDAVPYRKIQISTGVSTATVTRVARALQQGSGGYACALGKKKGGGNRA